MTYTAEIEKKKAKRAKVRNDTLISSGLGTSEVEQLAYELGCRDTLKIMQVSVNFHKLITEGKLDEALTQFEAYLKGE